MKATILTSVFAALVFSANLSAKNVKTYINAESGEFGSKKEYVSLDNETSKPLTKEYYYYDVDGKIIEKTVSKWNDKSGWVNCGKYEYQYGEGNKVANITFTEWDKKKNSWSDKSDFLVHLYDDNNEFMSVKQIQIDNNAEYNLVTQK